MRVVVLYSRYGVSTRERIPALHAWAERQGYELYPCFAMGPNDELVEPGELAARIAEAIESFRPDMLVIHAGLAYRRNTAAYLEALPTIARQYPSLSISYEDCGESTSPLAALGIFDQSESAGKLHKILF